MIHAELVAFSSSESIEKLFLSPKLHFPEFLFLFTSSIKPRLFVDSQWCHNTNRHSERKRQLSRRHSVFFKMAN